MTDDIKPAFLPKDREGAIRMIAEILYGRLDYHQKTLEVEAEDKYEDGYDACTRNEIRFIRNLLNVLECS